MDDIVWYPPEKHLEGGPPSHHVTTLIDIQQAGELVLHQPDPSIHPHVPDKIDALCEWISGLPQFQQVDSFIRRGSRQDDLTQPILLVKWAFPDQPPADLIDLIIRQLEPKPLSVTVTDIMPDRPPYSSDAVSVEVLRLRLPSDYQSAGKEKAFHNAFAAIDQYYLNTDSGRDAHDGPGDLVYLGRGWCLRRRTTTGKTAEAGAEHYFIHQWGSEEGEQRFKDPSRENYWPESPADLHETGFNKPVKEMEEQGMIGETIRVSFTGGLWERRRTEKH